MRHFKAQDGTVFGYDETDDTQIDLIESAIAAGMTEMDVWPLPPSADELAEAARAERDARIQAVAWRYERNAREQRLGIPPSDDIAALDAYVQALADLPKQKGFPAKIKWPTL